MRVVLIVLFCFQTCVIAEQQNQGFLLAAPNTLLSDSVEKICMSLHNNSGPSLVSISLIRSCDGRVLSKAATVVTSEGCMELGVPPTADQEARLVVRLQSADNPDLTSNSEVQVKIQTDPLVVIIFTDKTLYKPGQEVNFRVIILNHKLKPYNGKINKVWIETPSGIIVEQWRDLNVVEHGLVQLQFPLDQEAFLGIWKINVQHSPSKKVLRTFTVKEYVPATFKVVIKSPTEILPDSTSLSWNICAKYSHGELVQGDVHVEIKLQGSSTADQPNINIAVKLNNYTGCVEVAVFGAELGLADPLVRPAAVLLTATVTERVSRMSHSASALSTVHNQPFQLVFQCSHYFKPGLPYKGNVLMKMMDGRLRQGISERIQVCVKVRYRNQLAMKLLHCWNYTTDFSSQVVFALPDIDDPFNVQLISLMAVAVDFPTKLYPGSPEIMVLQPTVTQHVKPWYSPSHSYLDVSTRTTLACGTNHSVSVYYSVASFNQTTPQFFFLVESRGDLETLQSVVPSDESVVHRSATDAGLVKGWRLQLEVTPTMAPISRVTVYYVRRDREVVAGSTNLVIDRCFENKVRVRWNEPQVRPRQQVQLHVRASPYSVCGVTVTDRQLEYDSDSKENVWESLNRFILSKTPRDQREYCLNKISIERELPPSYDLRRKRSLILPPVDFAEHVDAITAFDDIGIMVVSSLTLQTRPCSKSVYSDEYYRHSFLFSNINRLFPEPLLAKNLVLVTEKEPVSSLDDNSIQSLVRDHFPDTWIWSLAHTGKEGEVVLNSTAPDSITSWDTKIICISEMQGLGMSHPTSVSVFLPFFIHIEAPYSFKMNEKVISKIIVYNYLHHPLPIELKFLKNDHLEIRPDTEVRLCLQPSSPHSVPVTIIPKLSGTANLIVEAKIQPFDSCDSPNLPSKSDTVVKQLTIKPEGFPEEKSQSAFICPSAHLESYLSWNFELPAEDNLVSGSVRLQFSVVADLLGPALENLDSLVVLPMGCGEQNLARLAPNIYVLKYMKAVESSNEQLKAISVNNIKKGYQRQLMFQRSDGSFSPFGEKDDSGSMWLTAAVVKTLTEAKDIIEVDAKVLQDAISWIIRQQLENGCFPAIGQLFHDKKEDEGEEELLTTLTALVLASLPETLPLTARNNAEFCLKAAVASPNPRLLALATLALSRLGFNQHAIDSLQNLKRFAITENSLTHWGSPDSSLSDNIVTSSYAVMALVEVGGTENMLTAGEAVRWICTSRNENGGFISTHDTVVALEALTLYMAALPVVNQTDLTVSTRGWSDPPEIRIFHLSEENKLVQQRLVTTHIPTTLSVAVVGNGCALIQKKVIRTICGSGPVEHCRPLFVRLKIMTPTNLNIYQSVLKYNVHRLEAGGHLELQVTSSPLSTVDPCGVQQLHICTSAKGSPVQMALLTVMIITGYSVDTSHLQHNSHPHVKKWEDEGDQVVFYQTNMTSVPMCLKMQLVRDQEVEDPLPAQVTLIDYYHPQVTSTQSYLFNCSTIPALDELPLSDAPATDRFDHFHNVDFDLETPEGDEGPTPIYVTPLPLNQTG